MTTTNTQTRLAALKAANPQLAGGIGKMTQIVQRDTIEEARAKIVTKLDANIAWATTRTLPAPDLVYKFGFNGFMVGVKYGNRYLTDWIDLDEGKLHTYMSNIGEAYLVNTLEFLKGCVQDGLADAAIKVAMQANADMHKPKH